MSELNASMTEGGEENSVHVQGNACLVSVCEDKLPEEHGLSEASLMDMVQLRCFEQPTCHGRSRNEKQPW